MVNIGSQKTILVTGAAGFIGRHLVLYLHNKGIKVLASGRQKDNIYFKSNRIPYIKLDVTDTRDFEKIGKDVRRVVHLAAAVPSKNNIKTTENNININGNGTLNLLRFCLRNKIDKLVNISTMGVYGFVKVDKAKEDSELKPYGDYADYAITKILAELFCERYRIDYNLDVITLRLCYVFGDFLKQNLLLSRLVNNAIKNKEIIIEGDGNNIFDLLYIDDCIKAIGLSLYSNKRGIYNIGSGKGIKLKEVAWTIVDYIYKIKKERIKIIYRDGMKSRKGYVLDIKKAKKDLGFIPQYYGRESIEKSLKDYFKNNI